MIEMDASTWERAQSIFAQAADLPDGHQRSFVEKMCGNDCLLTGSVLEMLDEDRREQGLLDGEPGVPLGQIADAVLQADHISALIERQVGPYRLLRLLGEGGMGVVYLAERIDIGGLVAIKLLRDAWMSPMRRDRFVLEQQTLVQLNHPAIARIYDASTMQDGTPWFVMEYADGRPITEFIRERAISVRDRLLLFRKVCEAVRYAHSLAIIHRDLKPSNIFVTTEGEIKLLDFGIAKQMTPETRTGDRTVAGLRLLTPEYAAPEQHTCGEVGVFTDVYSLGMLLYEILSGCLPESADRRGDRPVEKPSSAERKQRSSSVPLLSRRQWADLDSICLTAIEVEPEKRYISVDALIRDVTAYLEGRVLEARPASLIYSAGKFARRNWLALTSIAAGVLILAGAAIFFTVRLAHARDAAVAEARRTERIQKFMLDMLGNRDAEAAPSSELTVATLLEREAQHASSLNADPRTQIDLYGTIGTMYNRLAKFDRAEQMLSLALEKAKQTSGPQSDKVAELLVQLGTLHGDQGNVDTARQEVQTALDIARNNRRGPRDPTVIQGNISMARVDLQSGQSLKAIDILTPIAELDPNASGVDANDIRDSVSALAIAQLSAHHYELAGADGYRAIALDRKLLGEAHPQTGVDIVNLASIKATQGDLPAAEQLYREGIGIMQGWYGPDHPDVATAFGILGRILSLENKDAEAEPLLLNALRIQEKAYGPVHERVAFTLNALGEVALRRQDLASAESDFKQAISIDRKLFGEDDYKTASTESNLGNTYLKQSKYALAETTLRHVVATLALLPPGNNLIGSARARWGRSLVAMKRYDEAQVQLSSALELLDAQHTPPAAEVANVKSDIAALAIVAHRQPSVALESR